MSVDIKDRYQSMEEFCEALYGAVNERKESDQMESIRDLYREKNLME